MRKPERLLYLLVLLKLVLPFFLQNSVYEPHRDEYLYLAEAYHPAWGFMEVPPLLSVFAWITNLMGGSLFWVKIWPALFGAATFLLVGKLILHLGGRHFALVLGFFPFIWDGYLRLFFLFQPNFLEVFFWMGIAYSMARYIQTEKAKWLYVFGICVGLGFMSKYSVLFYTVSILAGLALTRWRKVFVNRHLYGGALVALLIALPNVWWQYSHNFPVLYHMELLREEQLQYVSPSGFLIGQLMSNLPCFFIWMAGLVFVISRSGQNYRVLGWAWLFLIIILVALHGKDYYALGAYPPLFALGAFYLEQLTWVKVRWTRFAMILFPSALGLLIMPLLMPLWPPQELAAYYEKKKLNKTGDFVWEDGEHHSLPQDFADMLGWKQLAEKTAAVYKGLPPGEQANTIIFCTGYFTAGALNYYGPHLGLPEAYSDNASFLWWMPQEDSIHNMIMVAREIPEGAAAVFGQFEKAIVADSMQNDLARENGTHIYLFEHAKPVVTKVVHQLMAAKRARFVRE